MSDLSFTEGQVERWVHSRIPGAKKQGREFRAKCPVHDGERLSLAINAETGQAFCHSECGRGWDLIGLEMELTGADFKTALASVESLVGKVNGARPDTLGQIVAAYDYTDEQGKLLYQVTRHVPKDFRQRRPDGNGGWTWGLKGTQRVPYRLPEVLKASEVFIVEGERDSETLRAMGFCATCNSGGAEHWRPEFARYFAGKHATIIPDNDEPGRKHALQVGENLTGTAASVRVLELPRGKDVSDWAAAGGDAEQLAALADNAEPLTQDGLRALRARWFPSIGPGTPAEPTEGAGRPETGAPKIRSVSDIPSVLDVATAEVSWVVSGWIAEGTVNVIASEPGAGKTTVALALASAIASGEKFAGMETAKRPALVLDRENGAGFIADVLKRLRVKDGGALRIWGGWLREQAPDPASAIVQGWALSCDPKPFIVIDSLVAFHLGNENDAGETRAFMQLCRNLADTGATVVLLHHSGKGESSQDYRGSSDIKAAADACFKLANIGPTSCLERLRIKPFKSRFLVDSEIILRYSDGVFGREGAGGSQRRTDAELLEELLKQNAGVTVREFEALAPQRGVARNYARMWLDNRVKDGCVRVNPGAKRAKLHTWVGTQGNDDEPPF
jgi:hypothetical protein